MSPLVQNIYNAAIFTINFHEKCNNEGCKTILITMLSEKYGKDKKSIIQPIPGKLKNGSQGGICSALTNYSIL